ncbi:Copper chaperone for superoxide dismutase, partial [Thalictrum thalictroides]
MNFKEEFKKDLLYKVPDIFSVVRLAQVNMEFARVEDNGEVFNPSNRGTEEPLGDLGTLDVQDNGEAFFSGVKPMLRVVDLIGRSIVLYEAQDKLDPSIAAAVVARSTGV